MMDGSKIAAVKLECRNLGRKHSIKTPRGDDARVVQISVPLSPDYSSACRQYLNKVTRLAQVASATRKTSSASLLEGQIDHKLSVFVT